MPFCPLTFVPTCNCGLTCWTRQHPLCHCCLLQCFPSFSHACFCCTIVRRRESYGLRVPLYLRWALSNTVMCVLVRIDCGILRLFLCPRHLAVRQCGIFKPRRKGQQQKPIDSAHMIHMCKWVVWWHFFFWVCPAPRRLPFQIGEMTKFCGWKI